MGEESKIEVRTKDLIYKELGIISSKLVTPGSTGFPDQIFWLPGGKPLLIEFKRPGEEASPKQIYIHNQLRQLNYQVEVHDNEIEAFDAILRTLEAARLPKESREILARARLRWATLRSRFR